MSETDEILGSQRLSMITSKHFSTFRKFKKKMKISQKWLEIEHNGRKQVNKCEINLAISSLNCPYRIFYPCRLTQCKITNLEFYDIWSHDPQGHMTTKM